MKKIWAQIALFFANEIKEKLVEALKLAVKAFKETLWNEIKEEVIRVLKDLLHNAEEFKNSKEVKEKEDKLIATVIDKIKLPFIAKPFKGLIKKMIKNKLDDLINEALNKGKTLVA